MAPPAGGDHDFAMPSSKPDHGPEPGSSRLTNADFRKLMMTPRSSSGSGSSGSTNPAVAALGAGAAAAAATSSSVKKRVSSGDGSSASGTTPSSSDKAEKRKKKKNYYAKLKKQEDDKMAELAIKYRDRAKERRDGFPDQPQRGGDDDEGDEGGGGESKETAGREGGGGGGGGSKSGPKGPAPHAAGGYRAVAPDLKSSHDAAERRKRMIQESKFLGGDMEHTHLVKGLDFALLQKVRSEIVNREKAAEEEEKLMKEIEKKEADPKAKHKVEKEKEEAPENQVECRTALAKGIIKTAFKTDLADRNELFFPGRMAYVMELEDETGGGHDKTEEDGHNPLSDIPTTTIRSKADVAGNLAHQQAVSMSANDIVINKLTSIFSYLRAARGKKKKKDRTAPQLPLPPNAAGINRKEDDHGRDKAKDKAADLPIFDDVGDYEPDHDKRSSRDDRRRGGGDRDRGRDRRDDRDRRDRDRRDRDRDRRGGGDRDRRDKHTSYFDRKDEAEAEQKGFSNQDKNLIKNLMKREEEKVRKEEESAKNKQMMSGSTENDFYAEAYPGIEMNDAYEDSDEEADYTKMDLGNKKGPVGRWDFDTAEEYSDYMSKKEALPKAAFQYGVKMTEGRKTRGKVAGGPRNEKAKLDKEWNKISSIIDKRKTGGGGGSGSASKKPKYD